MLVHSFQPSWKFAYKTWIALPQLAVQKYAFECGICLGQSLQHVGSKYVEMRRSSREKNLLRKQFWQTKSISWLTVDPAWTEKSGILLSKHRLFARCWEAIVWPIGSGKCQLNGTCAGNPMETPMEIQKKMRKMRLGRPHGKSICPSCHGVWDLRVPVLSFLRELFLQIDRCSIHCKILQAYILVIVCHDWRNC